MSARLIITLEWAPDNDPEPDLVLYPPPWRGPGGQGKCGACGRFLDRYGRCSLVLMTYRGGSPYGYEHR